MRNNDHALVVLVASFVGVGLLASCTPPGDPETPHLDTGTGTGFGGGETGVDEENFVTDGNCLTGPEGGKKAYRHHCGGNLEFAVAGQYFDGLKWQPTDEFGTFVGFGPTYAESWLEDDDVYETPFVAACCGGPYDFSNPDPSYPNNYALNCATDAIQQLCSALPRYFKALGDQSGVVKQTLYYDIADYLNAADVQTDCVHSLYEDSDPEHLVQNRSWQIVDNGQADYTLTIKTLEILEWDYPAIPDDVVECSSIYENDDNVIPLVEQLAGDEGNFTIAAGNGALSNSDELTIALDPGFGSVLSTVQVASSGDLDFGDLELRNFVLKGDATNVEVDSMSLRIERWNLRLVTPVVAAPLHGMYMYPAGSMTIVANVFIGGSALSLMGTNTGTVTVFPGPSGWVMRGFEVEYDDNGILWTYAQTSDLEFD